jgi:hypothetical protein
MMEPEDKIRGINAERSDLRQEIVADQQAIQRCVFAGTAASAILAGIYRDPSLLHDAAAQAFVIGIINQLVFGLVTFALMQWAAMNGVGDYISALEHKINLLAKDTITAWESKVARKAIFHPKSPAFWASMLFYWWLFFLFAGSSVIALRVIKSLLLTFIVGFEALFVLVLLVWGFRYRKRARQIIFRELGLANQLQVNPKGVKSIQQTVVGGPETSASTVLFDGKAVDTEI